MYIRENYHINLFSRIRTINLSININQIFTISLWYEVIIDYIINNII